MRVDELIKRLNTMNPETSVVLSDDQGGIFEIEDTAVVESSKVMYDAEDDGEQVFVIY
jgi:hypothetical protein